MARKFTTPRGTVDILPEEQPYWRQVLRVAEQTALAFGYRRIDTPVFEQADLFVHGTGEATDIVQREMYIFQDRSGEMLALRPEGTPNVCRAYLQHGMASRPQPVKLYYVAPAFRYERPQAGRLRQHTQFGCEAIGSSDPALDAEAIELLWRMYEALGLDDLYVLLNSIGDQSCRPAYVARLRVYYELHLAEVCDDCRRRYDQNPLRLLDCKNGQCQPVIAGAPAITDALCEPCAAHFASVQAYLDAAGVAWQLTPRLVRGLDYYTRTVFEIVPADAGSQGTIGSGGRYDGLMEVLGGPPTPGIGFATGIERIILNLRKRVVEVGPDPLLRVVVAAVGEGPRVAAVALVSRLRRAGVQAVVGDGTRSLKAQLRQAEGLAPQYVVIVGDEELRRGRLQVRERATWNEERLTEGELLARLSD